jgi:hypothetical protein
LLRRFDLDGSGQINEQEWQLVRAAAEREVRQLHQQLADTPATLHVRKPEDGKPYLINTLRRSAWPSAIAGGPGYTRWQRC